jgi:hypothetical protein
VSPSALGEWFFFVLSIFKALWAFQNFFVGYLSAIL